jgi:hypothetical protein
MHGPLNVKLSVTFSNVPLRSTCSMEEVLSGKSDTSGLGIALLMCWIIRILFIGLMEFCCNHMHDSSESKKRLYLMTHKIIGSHEHVSLRSTVQKMICNFFFSDENITSRP